MPQKPSQNTPKRQRLEDAAARLRATFQVVPGKVRQKKTAEEVLQQAWELAEQITAFALKYFPHLMQDQESGAFISPADFHKDLYQILLTQKYAAIAAPREHAKSTIVSVIFVVYCICYKLRRFIVIISDTQSQAAGQLAGVKAELETNHALRDDFGDLIGDKKWDVNDCRTSTDISIAARGAGQSLRGLRYRLYRPDLVICDDLESEEGVANPESREKLMRWFKGTVLNLGKNCQVFVIGTILHYESLLSELLDEEKFKRFKKRRYQAVDEEFSPASVLWPAKWDIASLKEKAETIGEVMFNQEFRNLPISESTQVFKEEWIVRHAYRREELDGKELVTITYNDPAISMKEKADFFASISIKVDAAGFIYVWRAEQDRMPFTKQLDFMVRRYDEEKPAIVGIEEIAYQAALKQALEELGRETGRYIPVVGVKNLTDKFLRVSTMGPLVENGTIRFCMDGTQKTLVSQLLFLGKIKDDLADALQGAVQLARQYTFTPVMASSNVQVGGRENSIGEDNPSTVMSRFTRVQPKPQQFVQPSRRSVWR